jgi:hypothetical protein
MADTNAQMETLKGEAVELAELGGHTLGGYEEFAGGAVNLATCAGCGRFVIAEVFPDGHDVRGSALQTECDSSSTNRM